MFSGTLHRSFLRISWSVIPKRFVQSWTPKGQISWGEAGLRSVTSESLSKPFKLAIEAWLDGRVETWLPYLLDSDSPGWESVGVERWANEELLNFTFAPGVPCEPPLRGKPLCFSSPPDDDFRRAECSSPERESSSWPQTVVTVRPTCPEARVVLVTFQNKLNSHREQPPP